MKKRLMIVVLSTISTTALASGADSVSSLPNIPCITQACPNGNTGGTLTLGAGCDPNNPAQDSAPETHFFECAWNGSGWTFGTNIDAGCSPSTGCTPAFTEWSQQTTVKKCDGTPRTVSNDFARCNPSGGEVCTMNWSDGTTSLVPGDRASVDAGTNYVTAYAAASVPFGSSCSPQQRYCVDNGSGGGMLTGSYNQKTCIVLPPSGFCYIPSSTPTRWKKMDMATDTVTGVFATAQTPICPNSKICKKISPVTGMMHIYITSTQWDTGGLNLTYSPIPPDCPF